MTRSTRQALGVTLLYGVVTCALTWPLLTLANREVAADMGDPVFVCWVLLWTGGQVFSFLSGDFGALSRYWHGNIFYPEPLTLAYSEHFTAQMLQALPVLAATHNVVLAYNLLFLSTFVLCGLGTFLLVRDLTGRPLAALVAGLAFAFAPYRIDQFPHLQVLSAQWMPFALYGFRRYLETGRRRALVGGAGALIAQNLSCGYYVMFFTPFAAAYVVYELAVRRRLGDWAAWKAFAAAGLAVGLISLPFLTPYLEVRRSGIGVRSLDEITMFSADSHAFATATARSWLWGERLAVYPRPEGQAFPGFAILALALIAIVVGIVAWKKRTGLPLSAWRQVLIGTLTVLLAGHLYASIGLLVTGGYYMPVDGKWLAWHQGGRVFSTTVVLVVGLAFLMKRRRRDERGAYNSPWLFFALAALVAGTCAMGPEILVKGAVVSSGPYAWLMHYVPGFDGLRVPARFVAPMTLFLAVLAGLGASALIARARRFGTVIVIVAGLCILAEAWPSAFSTNVRIGAVGLELTPRELRTGENISPTYKAIRDSGRPIALLEFPFGSASWDLHAVFYAGYHRQRLVNGYSGFFPERYQRLFRIFSRRREDPAAAWRALLGSGATHVLVHEAAYPPHRRKEISDWLLASGAREVFTDGTDRLFTIR
ncbi:MAG: hypothetical protein ABIP90_13235 [Vicinamibacterales bacterium]